jgi:hypothetical protein
MCEPKTSSRSKDIGHVLLPHVEGDPIHDLRLALGVSYEGQGLVLSVNCVFMQGP